MRTALRLTRWLLDTALTLLALSVLCLVLAANIGPGIGHQPVVIRGSSMSPAIPLGSLVDVTHVQPKDLKVGDVVTVKSPGGTVYTHRITRLVDLPDGLYVETQGDAVGQPDGPLQPVSVVTGRVGFSSPGLGYVLYLLTLPTGVLSVLSLALMMLFAIWMIEDLERANGNDFGQDGYEYESELARILDAQRTRGLIG